MKKIFVVLFVLIWSTFAFSEEKTKTVTAETKIGIVDLQYVIDESETGKKTKAVLDALIREKEAFITEKIKTKERFREEIEKQGTALSEEAKKAKLRELDAMEREITKLIDDSQAEVQRIQNNMKENILDELIDSVIESIGKQDGFAFIFPAGIILYSKDKVIDLTDTVIQRYDEFKVPKKKTK